MFRNSKVVAGGGALKCWTRRSAAVITASLVGTTVMAGAAAAETNGLEWLYGDNYAAVANYDAQGDSVVIDVEYPEYAVAVTPDYVADYAEYVAADYFIPATDAQVNVVETASVGENETVWHATTFGQIDPQIPNGGSLRAHEAVAMQGAEEFDFTFTGGQSGSRPTQTADNFLVTGGARRLNATLPDKGEDVAFRVEVQFTNHVSNDVRSLALEVAGSEVARGSSEATGDFQTVQATVAGGSPISVAALASLRIHSIRIIETTPLSTEPGQPGEPGDPGDSTEPSDRIESLWHQTTMSAVPLFGGGSLRAQDGVTMAGAEGFDFIFTGGNSGNPQGGHFVTGGSNRRLTATLPNLGADVTFRVEVDWASHDGTAARDMALEAGGVQVARQTSANNQDWHLLSHEFAGGTEFSILSLASNRIRDIRIIQIGEGENIVTPEPEPELPGQNANVNWGDATKIFNFRDLPNDGTQTGAGAANQVPFRPISERHSSIRTITDAASQPDFELLIAANGMNNGFRSNGQPGANFIDPNGGGRLLAASHALSGPIRVELDLVSVLGRPQFELFFGDQRVVFEVTGSATNPTTVYAEFPAGEGILRTGQFAWGGNVATDPVGRVGLQAMRIFEGEFTGPWLSAPWDADFNFTNLPYGYHLTHLETRYVEVTNVGIEATPVAATVGAGFEIVQAPAAELAAGASTVIGVRPVAGLPSGVHQAGLVIAGAEGVNLVEIPVSVTVNEPLSFPAGVTLFATEGAVSTAGQFPNVAEDIQWDNDFRRISVSEGQTAIRFNGELRDASANLAIPFVLNEVLWVPLATAQAALPGTTWTIDGDQLIVTAGDSIYYGTALVANTAQHGGDAVFVPVQEVAARLAVGNIGWDAASGTLVAVSGTAVRQSNVLYGDIHSQDEAWFGSPNSIAIANNFVAMQRANGGWPRGIGQTGAAPHQPDVGGMDPAVVAQIAGGFLNEDSYFGRGITTNETRFLLRMYEATGIESFLTSGLRGFDTIINTQDPIGGWPYQITGGSYHRALSINDDAHAYLLWLLMDIKNDGLYHETLGAERVAQAINGFDLGLDFLLNTQIRSAGFADGVERLTAWPLAVYQTGIENLIMFDHATPGVTGQPAWQREFEPPSISGGESVDIVRFLMSIPNPSPEVIEAIHAAVYFFNYVRIDGYQLNHNAGLDPQLGRNLVPGVDGARPVWGRFIDINTFEPLFYDRTGPFADVISPFQNVSTAAFIAENGPWQGFVSGFVSANATQGLGNTSANAVRAGTLRNLYRDAAGNLTTDRTAGTLDLAASFHNLSFERRAGFNYINHFAESLPAEYAEWLVREGIEAPGNETPGNEWEQVFADVAEDHTFVEYIHWLQANGLAEGWAPENGDALPTFRPSNHMSRAAMAAFLYRAAGSPEFQLPSTPSFDDIADTTFELEIEWLYAQGIARGWDDGTFRPSATITRQAMAAFLFRFHNISLDDVVIEDAPFVDVPADSEFIGYITWMAENDIATGWADDTFRPLAPVTREAMAAFIVRAHRAA